MVDVCEGGNMPGKDGVIGVFERKVAVGGGAGGARMDARRFPDVDSAVRALAIEISPRRRHVDIFRRTS